MKVLIADDMRVNRMLLREIFAKQFKWQVTEAVSAEEVRAENASMVCVVSFDRLVERE